VASESTELFSELKASIDALVAAGPVAFSDGPAVLELMRQSQRLAAVVSAAASSFDRSGDWAADGARSAVPWLSTRCRLPRGEVSRIVRRGRVVEDLPAASRAWFDGDLAGPHVDVLASLMGRRTADQLMRDESMLVSEAVTLSFRSFTQAAGYWEQLADPDGCEEAEERRRARRDVSVHQSFEGMWLGSITLDPIGGAIVAGELRRIEQRLFEADLADAKERCAMTPCEKGGLRRTAAQRRADALVEMATRSGASPGDGRRPAPLFSVLIDYPTLHGRVCELADGHVVTPGALVPWFGRADVERAVFGPDVRVEVGAASRFFSGATRRAIELRDRRCTHPMCDILAERCQVDHIVPWAVGGATTQENGRLLCGFHNRLRNQHPDPP